MLTHYSSGIDLGRTTHCHSGSNILGIFTHRGIAYISIDDQSHNGRQGDGAKEEELCLVTGMMRIGAVRR